MDVKILGLWLAGGAMLAFIFSCLVTKLLISALKKIRVCQIERTEGLEEHQSKTGTPTMGGIGFLAVFFVLTALAAIFVSPRLWALLLITLAFSLVGFIDDFLKVILRQNEGLKAWQKFLLQILVSTGFAVYLGFSGTSQKICGLDIGFAYYPLAVLFMTAFTNGTNFTDGVDGLLSTVTAVVLAFYVCFFLWLQPSFPLQYYAIPTAIMLGAILGFLVFNCHKADLFMGDTGSLAIGGFVSGMALLSEKPMILILVGSIYVIEVLSVILQVGYFKLSHGKRIFRMAPIHHHFEKGGWHETRVTMRFSIFTCLCVFIAIVFLLFFK